MKYYMYSIRDRKSGIFGNPFVCHNDECAKREFIAYCNLPKNVYLADDLELYFVGVFNSSTGEIESVSEENSKPLFLMNGVIKHEEL